MIPFACRTICERLLLEDDLGVAAEVAEVHPGLDRALGERQIEVVRYGAHHRIRLAHDSEHSLAVAHVERGGNEAFARQRLQEVREVVEMEVGEPDLLHFGILQQVIGTRRALQASAEDEHSHQLSLRRRSEYSLQIYPGRAADKPLDPLLRTIFAATAPHDT